MGTFEYLQIATKHGHWGSPKQNGEETPRPPSQTDYETKARVGKEEGRRNRGSTLCLTTQQVFEAILLYMSACLKARKAKRGCGEL